MHAIPFHRRILPWIFTIAFLAMAPALIFYTSGYRYDSKRGKVERNGTVILDSVPTGAQIWIDGRDSGKVTPITIQDMVPGTHQFRMVKNGYHEWQKNLDVYPELVTFINQVKLWPHEQPAFVFRTSGQQLQPSQTGAAAFLSASSTAENPALMAFSLSSLPSFRISSVLPLPLSADLRDADFFWSSDGRHAIATAFNGHSWLIDSTGRTNPIPLPVGRYRWEGRTAVGLDGRALVTVATDGTLTRSTFAPDVVDQIDDLELRRVTSTTQLVFISPTQPGKGFVLPPGDWRFWSTDRYATLLRDGNRWLSLTEDENGSFISHQAQGKLLRFFQDRKGPRALLISGNELAVWDPRLDPELLYRQSTAIEQADWDSNGSHAFFITANSLYVIELDPRDGRRLDHLASFDELRGLLFYKNTLLLLGKKGSEEGIWQMRVE